LIIAYEDLNELLPNALKIEQVVPRVPLIPKLIKMSEREVLYPSTPRYDYLRELARCEMENLKIKESEGHQIEMIQVDLPGNQILDNNKANFKTLSLNGRLGA